ncbi:class I SAM-dependent methyltransferase [Carnobacterium divergens]|uniref:class I SAM-dependent methyltransferase n=1 Tax=Carnobacterium divergens TaxID=2748 RepID=UPI001071D6FA|nr:class I SAM-dependent methyltransferase [Carnobacterium divergens]TFI76424.1 SAM-dependent methyltransferase [Carnobacterium divergens]
MGREFLTVFSEWATDYDTFVEGKDPAYQAVFKNYKEILNQVVRRSGDSVLEFGIGTGNLTSLLLASGKRVFPIEPSLEMRQLAKEKLPADFVIYDGDLEEYPRPTFPIDTIVSTYVFHHLTDSEKQLALKDYYHQLTADGKIIFADTMFESTQAYQSAIENAEISGFYDLASDLKREYYPLISTMRDAFQKAGFTVSFEQMNDFVWLVEAQK